MSVEIKCTGAQAVAVMQSHRMKYGYRAWQYGWPLLPKVNRGPEYWCADEIALVFQEAAGFDLRTVCSLFPSTVFLWAYFAGSPDWTTVAPSVAMAGDVVIFARGGQPFHIGMCRGPAIGDALPTIEGDTSSPQFPGSDSAGGAIAEKTRYVSQQTSGGYSMRIWRPPYVGVSTVTPVTSSNPAGWANGEQNLNAYLSPYDAKRLQTLLGVKADAIIGAGTIRALQAKFGKTQDGMLSAPDSGTVESLQAYLSQFVGSPWCRYSKLAVDGYFGLNTARALSAYLSVGRFTGANKF